MIKTETQCIYRLFFVLLSTVKLNIFSIETTLDRNNLRSKIQGRIDIILPYLSNLRIRNEFTDLLFNVCSHNMSSREDSSLLSEIREPVWSYIINLCSSFTARDCNACFNQIFEKRTFSYLNEEEESPFMTLRTFDSFCSSCSNFVTLNSSILLTVVTVYGLNQSG